MQKRIVFNGKEYAGIQQMPADVRKAFLAAVAQIGADADGNGVPDVLEGKGNVAGLPPSSITVNGRSVENLRDLPRPVQWVLGYALRRVTPQLEAEAARPTRDPLVRQLDATAGGLRTVLYLMSTFMAAGLATIGIWVIVHMDASSRSQGGAFYVGIGVAIALAWMVGSMISLVLRRR
jgi:phage-related protein